jgi:hypothetical protein
MILLGKGFLNPFSSITCLSKGIYIYIPPTLVKYIECNLLNVAANRVQSTSFSVCEIFCREEALVSFVRERERI